MAEPFEPVPESQQSPDDPPAPRTNPRAVRPNDDTQLGALGAPELSLVEDLADVVDDLRQLNTDFGLRPYRVFSVVYRWTGGAKGRGDAVLESETEFLPTPNITEVDQLRGQLTSGGTDEQGRIRMDEISPRYTEDDIRALFHVQPLPDGDEGFLEMRVDQRDGSTARRRFTTQNVPMRRADKFDWTVRLLEQQPPRSRSGVLPQPGLRS